MHQWSQFVFKLLENILNNIKNRLLLQSGEIPSSKYPAGQIQFGGWDLTPLHSKQIKGEEGEQDAQIGLQSLKH